MVGTPSYCATCGVAQYAPIGGTLQPWRLTVVGAPELAALHEHMRACLAVGRELDPLVYAI